MSRLQPRIPLAALPAAALAVLLLAHPAPLRAPVEAGPALAAGAALGAALFLALSGRSPRSFGAVSPLVASAAVAIGASEEVIWRAFVLVRLAPDVGVPGAVAVCAVGFAATHYPAQGARGVLVHTGTGAAFGALFAGTGSLLATVTAHAVYNLLALAAKSPTLAPPAAATTPGTAIEVGGVEKHFGRVAALRGVDLTIMEGEIVALLGPNGAGKTTLVSILLGLRHADAGMVRILGSEPRSLRARRAIAATPQEMSFPPTLKVREIVDFVLAHYPDRRGRDALLERFGLDEIAGRQTGGISPGQRRRLAIALAFASRPRATILDEPTTGLDVESRIRVWAAIRDYAATGGTVLLTTHYLEEAETLAHRIVVLSEGRVAAEGTPADLRGSDRTLQDAYLRLTGGTR